MFKPFGAQWNSIYSQFEFVKVYEFKLTIIWIIQLNYNCKVQVLIKVNSKWSLVYACIIRLWHLWKHFFRLDCSVLYVGVQPFVSSTTSGRRPRANYWLSVWSFGCFQSNSRYIVCSGKYIHLPNTPTVNKRWIFRKQD